MKKLILFCLVLIFTLSVVGCNNNEQFEKSNDFDGNFTLKATIIEIANNDFIVEPIKGSWELNSTNRIEVPMEKMSPSPEPQVGDIIEVVYRGELLETDPARLTDIQSVKVVKKVVAETPNNSSIEVKENCVAVIGKGTLSQAVELSVEDTNLLLKAVENNEWVEDNPRCIQDCAITLKGNLYYYHSSCGTLERIDLSEVSTQSSKEPKHSGIFILDNETKDLVNTVLEKYIELEK